MKDEYLLLSQVAFLLHTYKQQIDSLIDSGQLPCCVRQNTRLIRVSALDAYVKKKMEKYKKAREYFLADNKSLFWHNTEKKFHNTNIHHDDSGMEYLTVSQAAYLLGISRQAVHGLIRRNRLQGRFIETSGHTRTIILIRADEIKKFLKTHDKKYDRAVEFLKEEDHNAFWDKYSAEVEQHWRFSLDKAKSYYFRKKEQQTTHKKERIENENKKGKV